MVKKRKRIMILLMVIMLFGTGITVQAASKDVTRQYKTAVSKMLNNFDFYLGYSFGSGIKFKFDVYTRTTMVYYNKILKVHGKSLSYASKKCKSDMKTYFGNTTTKLKKFSGYGNMRQPSDLIVNKNNKVTYICGDWGTARPRGKVVKILKNGKNYEVLYDINKLSYYQGKREPEYDRYLGRFKVTLKKAENEYGFIITNMKRIRNVNGF